MKILKIENNNGYFRCSGSDEWNKIDQIDADSLMKLLNFYLENVVELEPFDESLLGNQAQKIIYKSIYSKFSLLNDAKNKFKDESEKRYLTAMQKYQEQATEG